MLSVAIEMRPHTPHREALKTQHPGFSLKNAGVPRKILYYCNLKLTGT